MDIVFNILCIVVCLKSDNQIICLQKLKIIFYIMLSIAGIIQTDFVAKNWIPINSEYFQKGEIRAVIRNTIHTIYFVWEITTHVYYFIILSNISSHYTRTVQTRSNKNTGISCERGGVEGMAAQGGEGHRPGAMSEGWGDLLGWGWPTPHTQWACTSHPHHWSRISCTPMPTMLTMLTIDTPGI